MKNTRKKSNGWLLKITAIAAFCFIQFAITSNSFGQCQPYIKIDGNLTLANQIVAAGIALPAWLTAGHTLAVGQMVNSISVVEFTIANGNSLQFSQVLLVTTVQTVPNNTVWKIESIFKQPSFNSLNGATYPSAGTYTFKVPPCAEYICIEAWGAGGGSGSTGFGGGGGGGGGYGQQCFSVTPTATYTVTVGAGGTAGAAGGNGGLGGTSSVSTLISVTGGNGGAVGAASTGGAGGTGGSSTATSNVSGGTGQSLTGNPGGAGGAAGAGPNGGGGTGGAGGPATTVASPGGTPGGGGGGGGYTKSGGAGGDGRVIITW